MKRHVLLGALVLLALTGSGTAASPQAKGPIAGKLRAGRGTVNSTNWSGYAAFGTTFTDVKGTWTQPTADCSSVRGPPITLAAFFVGLDGYNSRTVEQTGTDADCLGPTPQYRAWYEFYPAQAVFLDPDTYPVASGDTLTAEVSQSGTTVTVSLQSSQGWTKTATASAAGLGFTSAEWIAEAPFRSLTNFGSVSFSAASASNASLSDQPISSWSNDEITLVDHPGPTATVRAEPSALSGGTAFTITWKHK